MLTIVAVLLAWIPALVGLGTLLRHGGDPELRPAIAGFLGTGILGAAALIVNFGVPVSAPFAAVFWISGVALLVARGRWVLREARLLDLVATLLLTVVVARLAWPPEQVHYDTGLYHLQTVRWLREHPVQLGLASLHYRLAFDSLWHAAAAGMELPFAGGKSIWFANALPIVFAASAGVTATRRLVLGDRSFPNLFLAGVLVLATAALPSFPGLGTDFVAALLAYLGLALWARALEDRAWPGPDAEPATLLCLVSFLVKLSGSILVGASAAILALGWRRVAPEARRRLALASAVLVVPWLLRNLLLSGCGLFPVAGTCVPWLSWSYGAERTRVVEGIIRAWARKPFAEPAQVLEGFGWLRDWPALYASPDHELMLGVLAVGALLGLAFVRSASRAQAFVIAVALAGTAFCFHAAPNPRFAYGYLYPLAIAPLSSGLAGLGALRWLDRSWVRLAIVAALLLGVQRLYVKSGVFSVTRRIAIPWVTWPTRPLQVSAERRMASEGLEVSTPATGDQCWDNPLPCTPYFDPALRWSGRTFSTGPRRAPDPM